MSAVLWGCLIFAFGLGIAPYLGVQAALGIALLEAVNYLEHYGNDEELGHPREGFPAGMPFDGIPPDWCCPDCGVREQQDFLPVAGVDAAMARTRGVADIESVRATGPSNVET